MSVILTVTFTKLHNPLSRKTSAVCIALKNTYRKEMKKCITDMQQ
jgi:hypothetical protein